MILNKPFVAGRNLILIAVAFSFFLSCKFRGKGYHISGEVKNLSPNSKIYLEELNYNSVVTIDTTSTKINGSFELKGFIKHEGLYRIRFNNNKYVMLVMDEKPQYITVHTDTASFIKQPYTIEGSPLSMQLRQFLVNVTKRYKSLQDLSKMKNDSIHPPTDSLKKVYEAEIQEVSLDARQFITQYVDTVSDPIMAVYAVYNFLSPQTDMPVFQKLADKLSKNYAGVPLAKDFVADMTQTPSQKFANGTQLPEIEMKDISGKTIKLSSLRGKIVLVDFWASWCAPCRAENPNVVKAYNDFKDKGFTVFSVSLDTDKDKWAEAIKKDGLAWPYHVSELAGWKSRVCDQFGITSIPSNYLIDKDGKVIASDLQGNELENILSQQMK